jgi:DNA-binding response OmpR family regulator
MLVGGEMEDATIVVVEDDSDIRELLRDVLSADGYQVVDLAQPALELIRRVVRPPVIFILDIMLPGLNGVELARWLRDVYPGAPMIAMSASRLKLEMAASSGLFSGAIAKPFDLITLTEVVSETVAAITEDAQSRPRSIAS